MKMPRVARAAAAILVAALAAAAIYVLRTTSNKGGNLLDGSGTTPMTAAIYRGDQAEVERLLAAGQNPNLPQAGVAPLALAASFGNSAIVRSLLEAGAEPNVRGPDGSTPLTSLLMQAAPVSGVRALIERGASLTLRGADGHTPLEAGAAGATPEHLDLLLVSGAPFGPPEGQAALRWAVTFDKVENVRFLLRHGVDPNGIGDDGLTALQHFAASKGRKRSLAALLDAGADPDKPAERGMTARMAAKNTGNDDLIELLSARPERRAP